MIFKKSVFFLLLAMTSHACVSENFSIDDLTLSKIRAVGNHHGTVYDNTIELWFTATLNWPAGSGCTNNYRVYVDAKHSHIISAAYMALASGAKMKINIDNSLPKRSGACEVSYIDVLR